jgi:hypothetical protein
MVGVLDSALLALRRMAALDASATCPGHPIRRLRECGRTNHVAVRTAFGRTMIVRYQLPKQPEGELARSKHSALTTKGLQPKLEAFCRC